jgi:hypothetical protein
MSSLVKFAGARLVHQLDLSKLAAGVEWQIEQSGMSLRLSGARTYAATGEAKDTAVTEVAGNQRVYIPLGIVHTYKYQSMVEVHPALYSMGEVQVPRIGEPGEDVPLVIRLRAWGPCIPHALPWLVRLYLLD